MVLDLITSELDAADDEMRITDTWTYRKLKIHDKESEYFPLANISRKPSNIRSYLNRLSLQSKASSPTKTKNN